MSDISLSPTDQADLFTDQNGLFYLYDAVTQTFTGEDSTVYVYNDSGVLAPVVNTNQASPYADTSTATMQAWANKNLPGANVIVQQQAKSGETYLDTLIRCLPNMALGAQQLALANINYQRAKAGQPPLDMSQYSGVSASVGLSPDTQKLLMYGVGAIVVAMLLKGNNGGRK